MKTLTDLLKQTGNTIVEWEDSANPYNKAPVAFFWSHAPAESSYSDATASCLGACSDCEAKYEGDGKAVPANGTYSDSEAKFEGDDKAVPAKGAYSNSEATLERDDKCVRRMF